MNNIKCETSIKKNFRYHQQYFTNKSSLRNNIPPVYFLSHPEKSKKLFEQQQITSVLNINHICFTQVKKKKNWLLL